tara:strand:+ start:6902 stop:8470 length:1569 start_codon:yes stop_codon:yes gene_type:complete
MAVSTIIKKKCPTCGKTAIEKSRMKFGAKLFVNLECGHSISDEQLLGADYSKIVSNDGKTLMPFQVNGVKFVESANGRALIADEQGLGKTVQDLGFLGLHPECFPVVHVTKTTLTTQMYWEVQRWLKNLLGRDVLVQVIKSGKEMALPGFDFYVLSYDMLKNENMFMMADYKTVVFDECQAIKNHTSGRAKAAQKIASTAQFVIGLSGTPIKNNAGEYFTILNILHPERFPSYQRFLTKYCDTYDGMYGTKIGGLSNVEQFRMDTDDFIIRRTQEEVLPDMPKLSRRFHHVELNSKFNAAYAQTIAELDSLLYSDEEDDTMTAMIAIMTKMRRITGLSKALECVDFVEDHIESTGRKITLFLHHHDVAELLVMKLNDALLRRGLNPVLNLHSGLNSEQRHKMVTDFEHDAKSLVMVASTLASGEGLNLQFCNDAVMLERQWNPANEEQAEKRFHRYGQTRPVTITYMLASETIDEYFTELVEQKRAIVANTLDGKELDWNEQGLLKELAHVLVTKGAKKWKL